jgi:hypothetical protein
VFIDATTSGFFIDATLTDSCATAGWVIDLGVGNQVGLIGAP